MTCSPCSAPRCSPTAAASRPGSRCRRREARATASCSADREREPAHGLPGGGLPEHRRVLAARHGHVHDPRRHLHAPVRLLQRQDRQADLERPARAGPGRAQRGPDGAAPRGHHQRRPRRPARLRGGGVRRRDPADPPPGAALQGRGADARLPRRGDAAGQGDRRATRRLQPQRRGRAAAVSRGPPRLEVRALLPRAAERQGDGRRRGRHEVGADGRPRRELRGDGRRARDAARASRPGAHGRPVPASDRATICRSCATGIRTSSPRSRRPPTRSASSTSRPGRWCVELPRRRARAQHKPGETAGPPAPEAPPPIGLRPPPGARGHKLSRP